MLAYGSLLDEAALECCNMSMEFLSAGPEMLQLKTFITLVQAGLTVLIFKLLQVPGVNDFIGWIPRCLINSLSVLKLVSGMCSRVSAGNTIIKRCLCHGSSLLLLSSTLVRHVACWRQRLSITRKLVGLLPFISWAAPSTWGGWFCWITSIVPLFLGEAYNSWSGMVTH